MNDHLPDGFELEQKCSAKFSTTFDAVEQFLKSHILVVAIPDENMLYFALTGRAKELLSFIYQMTENGVLVLPALRAMLDVFTPLRRAQTLLESSRKITIASILSLHEKVKWQLSLLADDFSSTDVTSNRIMESHDLACTLARNNLAQIQNIPYFDVWAAVCVAHAGLRNMKFLKSQSKCLETRLKGEELLQKLLVQVAPKMLSTNPSNNPHRPIALSRLGVNSFSPTKALSYLRSQQGSTDNLFECLFCKITEDQQLLLQSKTGIVDYWIKKDTLFLNLSKIMVHFLAITAISSSCEQGYNILKSMLFRMQTVMKDDIKAGILFHRFLLL